MADYNINLPRAFPVPVRQAFSESISKAYYKSVEISQEFGSFYRIAHPYLRWLYSQLFLEKAAKQHSLNYQIAPNKANNSDHIIINSRNWSLTTHHLPRESALPRKALYRAAYAHKNYDLFENHPSPVLEGGYVLLLHDGKGKEVEALSFVIPTPDECSIVYSEPLEIIPYRKVKEEIVEDELDDKIKLRTEAFLKTLEKNE